jgi:moderate conductance mechanosensitive channel
MEEKMIKAVIIFIGSVVLSRIVPKLIRFPESKGLKAKTIADFLKNGVVIIIFGLAGFSILSTFGVDMTPYLLSSSIIGFAVGFGAQSLIKDIIAGVYLLLEPEFRIGKQIEIGSYVGEIKKVTLKNTYLKDTSGGIYIIPNGEIKVIHILAKDLKTD